MTENEAIEELKFSNEKCLEQCEGACSSRKNNDCACQDAVIERMLDELLQYREIGTVEQVRNQKHNLEMAYKIISDYEAIGTVEECREAVEKQNPKKPKEILRHRGGFEMHHCPNCDTHYQTDNRYTIKDNYCPVCRKLLDSAFRKYCGNCGQAIAENLEGMEDV